MEEQALKIIELRADNIKRLKAVQIVPDGDVVILGGKNEQGKTTILDCIEWAIAGTKAVQGVPVRRGQHEGSIFLDLGELTIERAFDPTGSKLIVRDAAGAKQSSPQALLDKLYSKVAFRPLEFATLKPADQLARLKEIVGLDFSDLDAQRKALYEKRTNVGRTVDAEEAKFSAFPAALVNAPDVEVSVAELMAEKEAADKANRDAEDKLSRTRLAAAKVADLKRQLEDAMGEEAEANADAEGVTVEDTSAIVEAIKGAEDVNRQVRAKHERAKSLATLKAAEKARDELTMQIEAIDAEKATKMGSAKWPIPGLGFGDNGVTLDGLPFEQASKAQKMRTSFAIGMEQNPRLRVVLMPDASLLDSDSLDMVNKLAEDHNMQRWIERVGDGDKGALIIEDGEIVGKVATPSRGNEPAVLVGQ